ncbi:unnamed protein product [Amoebophrya sp. A25]|nr:unnamed protein product [Amoebophrya sp. A25]|eukprot:GSA25T00010274001.1
MTKASDAMSTSCRGSSSTAVSRSEPRERYVYDAAIIESWDQETSLRIAPYSGRFSHLSQKGVFMGDDVLDGFTSSELLAAHRELMFRNANGAGATSVANNRRKCPVNVGTSGASCRSSTTSTTSTSTTSTSSSTPAPVLALFQDAAKNSPSWLDWDRFKGGQDLWRYKHHLRGNLGAQMALFAGFVIARFGEVLLRSGYARDSHIAGKRYTDTAFIVSDWFRLRRETRGGEVGDEDENTNTSKRVLDESDHAGANTTLDHDARDAIDTSCPLLRSIFNVRVMHALARKASRNLFDEKTEGIPLSQSDMVEVLLGFTAVPFFIIEKEFGIEWRELFGEREVMSRNGSITAGAGTVVSRRGIDGGAADTKSSNKTLHQAHFDGQTASKHEVEDQTVVDEVDRHRKFKTPAKVGNKASALGISENNKKMPEINADELLVSTPSTVSTASGSTSSPQESDDPLSRTNFYEVEDVQPQLTHQRLSATPSLSCSSSPLTSSIDSIFADNTEDEVQHSGGGLRERRCTSTETDQGQEQSSSTPAQSSSAASALAVNINKDQQELREQGEHHDQKPEQDRAVAQERDQEEQILMEHQERDSDPIIPLSEKREMIYTWRVIAFFLGIRDEYNVCESVEKMEEFFQEHFMPFTLRRFATCRISTTEKLRRTAIEGLGWQTGAGATFFKALFEIGMLHSRHYDFSPYAERNLLCTEKMTTLNRAAWLLSFFRTKMNSWTQPAVVKNSSTTAPTTTASSSPVIHAIALMVLRMGLGSNWVNGNFIIRKLADGVRDWNSLGPRMDKVRVLIHYAIAIYIMDLVVWNMMALVVEMFV